MLQQALLARNAFREINGLKEIKSVQPRAKAV